MRRTIPLAILLGGCTAIAPFGDFRSEEVDGGATDSGTGDSGPAPMCEDGGVFSFDAGPVPTPTGSEVCDRQDNDGDIRADENLFAADAPSVAEVPNLGDQLRATAGLRPDSVFVAFNSAASASRGHLRIAEVQLGTSVAQERVLSGAPVGVFDVAAGIGKYIVVWVEANMVRFATIDPCGLSPTTTITLDTSGASSLRVETTEVGNAAIVAWVTTAGSLAAVRVDITSAPVIGPTATAGAGPGNRFVEAAVATAQGRGWIAAIQRGPDDDSVTLRGLNDAGALGATVHTNGTLEGNGPFQNINLVGDPEDFVILTYDTVGGPAYGREIQLPAINLRTARLWGGDATIFDSANDRSPTSAVLLSLGSFAVERVGATPDSQLSTDAPANVPILAPTGWLAIVGFREGPYRYAAVGRDGSGALQYQTVRCINP